MHEVDVCLDLIKDKKDASQFMIGASFFIFTFPLRNTARLCYSSPPAKRRGEIKEVVVLDRYVKNVFNKMNK